MLSLLSCHPFKAEWIVPLCPVLRKTAWRAKSCWFSRFIPAARPAGTPHRGQRTNQISAGIAFKTPWVRCRILESKDGRVGEGRCTQVHGGGQGTVCLVLLPHTDQCGLVSSRHPGSVRMDLMLLSGYPRFQPQGKLVGKDEMYSPLKTDCPWRLTPTSSSRSTTPNPVLGESTWPKHQGYCWHTVRRDDTSSRIL